MTTLCLNTSVFFLCHFFLLNSPPPPSTLILFPPSPSLFQSIYLYLCSFQLQRLLVCTPVFSSSIFPHCVDFFLNPHVFPACVLVGSCIQSLEEGDATLVPISVAWTMVFRASVRGWRSYRTCTLVLPKDYLWCCQGCHFLHQGSTLHCRERKETRGSDYWNKPPADDYLLFLWCELQT